MKSTNPKHEIVFRNGIPPKNRFIVGLLFLKFPLLVPFIRYIVKTQLKYCKDVHFFYGFRYLYGNIHAINVDLGDTLFLDYVPIYIGDGTRFSLENIVITSTHERNNFGVVKAKPIKIGKNVWITTRCTILGGVTIGDNSIIGAGSVVTKDIPPNCFAAGNPCKVIKYF